MAVDPKKILDVYSDLYHLVTGSPEQVNGNIFAALESPSPAPAPTSPHVPNITFEEFRAGLGEGLGEGLQRFAGLGEVPGIYNEEDIWNILSGYTPPAGLYSDPATWDTLAGRTDFPSPSGDVTDVEETLAVLPKPGTMAELEEALSSLRTRASKLAEDFAKYAPIGDTMAESGSLEAYAGAPLNLDSKSIVSDAIKILTDMKALDAGTFAEKYGGVSEIDVIAQSMVSGWMNEFLPSGYKIESPSGPVALPEKPSEDMIRDFGKPFNEMSPEVRMAYSALFAPGDNMHRYSIPDQFEFAVTDALGGQLHVPGVRERADSLLPYATGIWVLQNFYDIDSMTTADTESVYSLMGKGFSQSADEFFDQDKINDNWRNMVWHSQNLTKAPLVGDQNILRRGISLNPEFEKAAVYAKGNVTGRGHYGRMQRYMIDTWYKRWSREMASLPPEQAQGFAAYVNKHGGSMWGVDWEGFVPPEFRDDSDSGDV